MSHHSHTQKQSYEVIVVGAGISGLLSALALSKEGKHVLILEKEEFVGGVCRSYMVDGYKIDTGPHMITRLGYGPLRELMTRYFTVSPIFVPHGRYYVRLGGRMKPFPWNLKDWLSFDLLPPIDRLYLMKTLFSVSYLFSSNPNLGKMSVGELIGNGISEQTKHFLDCMSYFMTGTSVNETPVSRFIDSQKYKSVSDNFLNELYSALMKEGAKDQMYPKGGVQSITDSIIASMPKDKVELHLNEPVKSIETKDGVNEVETKTGAYESKTVVYSGFASDLNSVVKNLPKDYVERISKIKRVNALVIWLGLNKSVFPNTGSEIWADSPPYCWVVPTSNYDPTLAPNKHQLAGFVFILPEKYDIEQEKKKAMDLIHKTLPEIQDSVEMTHYQHLVPEKAAMTIDAQFVDIKTPIDGLYVVGTDTERRSMGVTRASYSVLNLLSTLRKDGILK